MVPETLLYCIVQTQSIVGAPGTPGSAFLLVWKGTGPTKLDSPLPDLAEYYSATRKWPGHQI